MDFSGNTGASKNQDLNNWEKQEPVKPRYAWLACIDSSMTTVKCKCSSEGCLAGDALLVIRIRKLTPERK